MNLPDSNSKKPEPPARSNPASSNSSPSLADIQLKNFRESCKKSGELIKQALHPSNFKDGIPIDKTKRHY